MKLRFLRLLGAIGFSLCSMSLCIQGYSDEEIKDFMVLATSKTIVQRTELRKVLSK
jgi:hypothetical protein